MRSSTVLRELDLVLGSAKKSDILRAYRMANNEGTIQARDAVALFPNRPEKHAAISITQALIALGCDWKGMSQWRRNNSAV